MYIIKSQIPPGISNVLGSPKSVINVLLMGANVLLAPLVEAVNEAGNPSGRVDICL
jgi:2-keto-3-deoxy-L-rhamnonate aldolase RhmA